jgi:hypothetical protein
MGYGQEKARALTALLEEDLRWYVDQLYQGCSNAWGCFIERLRGPKWERGFLRSINLLNNLSDIPAESKRLRSGFHALAGEWALERFEGFVDSWEKEARPEGYDSILFFNQELVDLVDILLEERWKSQKVKDKFYSELKNRRLRRSEQLPIMVSQNKGQAR